MARRCAICGKGPLVGYQVSHSGRRTKRRWYPNLIKVRLSSGKKIKICNSCRKKSVERISFDG